MDQNSMPDHDDEFAVSELAQEIRAYLAGHPNAEDSLRGVVNWWLVRQRYQQTSEMVQRALDYLVAEGTVERRRLPDGRETYLGVQRGDPH
jgi:hypothetical protein